MLFDFLLQFLFRLIGLDSHENNCNQTQNCRLEKDKNRNENEEKHKYLAIVFLLYYDLGIWDCGATACRLLYGIWDLCLDDYFCFD